ncbi:MAG TPA: alpha/beta hydrolase-fold protein [Thermoanaerobaculia bacterium]|nr:alpha/beta hydrolase-fold protein [Thermoanaerobaculia bacterium]
MREMRDTLRATFGRVLRRDNRRQAVRRGTLERVGDFSRPLTVYLPPGYERGETRYPVLYMHDGQNLFDPERSFVRGQPWRLNEAADAAIGDCTAEPMIIVGIDHAGPGRIDEYTPTRDDSRQAGGKAGDYARMLIDQIKPLIDSRYRSLPDDTSTAGSSLGGLVSLYLGLTRPDLFRRIAAMSPSVWWNDRSILGFVDRFEGPRPRIWLDVGGREGRETLRDARTLRDRLLSKGWSSDDLEFREDPRGDHSERAWARRARPMIEFLFGARR